MKIKISQQGSNHVKVNNQGTNQVVAVGIQGPPGTSSSNTISGAGDVDVSNLRDGSVLVYETESEKWKSTTLLNKQAIDAGEF